MDDWYCGSEGGAYGNQDLNPKFPHTSSDFNVGEQQSGSRPCGYDCRDLVQLDCLSMHVKITTKNDEERTLHVVEVTKSSLQKALDERRLQYEVSTHTLATPSQHPPSVPTAHACRPLCRLRTASSLCAPL